MALPSLAQHPFKIQSLFKSNRLCWALSCGSLSTAALLQKDSNACSRKRNQLEAPWCRLYQYIAILRSFKSSLPGGVKNFPSSTLVMSSDSSQYEVLHPFLHFLRGPSPSAQFQPWGFTLKWWNQFGYWHKKKTSLRITHHAVGISQKAAICIIPPSII